MITNKLSPKYTNLDSNLEKLYIKAKSDYLTALHVDSKQSLLMASENKKGNKSVFLSENTTLNCNSKHKFVVPPEDSLPQVNLNKMNNICIPNLKSNEVQSVSDYKKAERKSNITTNYVSNASEHITLAELKANEKVASISQSSISSQQFTSTAVSVPSVKLAVSHCNDNGSQSDGLNHSSISIQKNKDLPSNTDKLKENENVSNLQSNKLDFDLPKSNISPTSTFETCEDGDKKSEESLPKSDFGTVSNLDERFQSGILIKDIPSGSQNNKCTDPKMLLSVANEESVSACGLSVKSNVEEKSLSKCVLTDMPSDAPNEKGTETKVIVQKLPPVYPSTVSALMGFSAFCGISRRIANRSRPSSIPPWAANEKRPPEDSSPDENRIGINEASANSKASPASYDSLGMHANKGELNRKKMKFSYSSSEENGTHVLQKGKRKCIRKKRKKHIKNSVAPIRNLHFNTGNGIEVSEINFCENSVLINPNLKFITNSGMKLSEINHAAIEIAKAPAQVLRILHYILFGTYGLTANETVLKQTRQNILHFRGFRFDENSPVYSKKRMTLMNLPYPLLAHIHDILLKSSPLRRADAVSSVLQFLLSPTDKPLKNEVEDLAKQLSEHDVKRLKTAALKAQPFVLLKQLSEEILEQSVKESVRNTNEHLIPMDKYVKPSFIKNGIGRSLKSIPLVVHNIQTARRRIVNLLHSLLFGRPGSEDINRQNILEFNGFTANQSNFVGRRMAMLSRLRTEELIQLCDVFALRAKAGNKNRKIKTLLEFLAIPGNLSSHDVVVKRKYNKKKTNLFNNHDRPEHNTSTKETAGSDVSNGNIPEKPGSDVSNGYIPERPDVKLRDFPDICSKIECASPQDLLELNDLLFVKPCETSEIHQKILDFTSFPFSINSFDFHYRKTLMHYMDFKTIRKIAELLQIEDWETYRSPLDLSQNILNFLMNMKLPDRKRRSALALKKRKKKTNPNILMLHSCGVNKNSSKSSSSSPEFFDSTYASEELYENAGEFVSVSPHNSRMKRSQYRHRPYRNGALSKKECNANDSTPLFEIVQHPTDKELHHEIDKVISCVPFSLSLGELVKKVLSSYPNFNLNYRIDFIRNKALEILRQLREEAV